MIDRAHESVSAPNKLAMRILFYELCSSINNQNSHSEGVFLHNLIEKENYDKLRFVECFIPYKLAMRILFYELCSSIRS